MSEPSTALPSAFPQGITPPKFKLGDRVRWQPQPTQDFGIVTGLQYSPTNNLQAWSWKYVIWLDDHSSSRAWVVTDSAWESDLELIAEFACDSESQGGSVV